MQVVLERLFEMKLDFGKKMLKRFRDINTIVFMLFMKAIFGIPYTGKNNASIILFLW